MTSVRLFHTKILAGSLIFLSLYSGALFVLATPPVSPYIPSEQILDPTCLPTGPNCFANPLTIGETVGAPASIANQVLYVDGNGKLASDSSFTRTGIPITDPTGVYLIANMQGASIQDTVNNTTTLVIGHVKDVSIDDNLDHSRSVVGLVGQVHHEGTGTIDNMIGLAGQTLNATTGLVNEATGVLGRVQASSTGVVTEATAFVGQFKEINANTITNAYVLKSGEFDAVNKYGVYIDEPGSVNLLYELQLKDQSALKWFDLDSSNYVGFTAPDTVTSNILWKLPSDNTAGVLTNDGSGNLSWGVGGGGSSSVQTVKVSLSQSQILSLYTTPVELISAPGVGKYIKVLGIDGQLNFGTMPYSSTQLSVYMTTDGMGLPHTLYEMGGMVNFLESTVTILKTFAIRSGDQGMMTIAENNPLMIKALNSDPTGGDGTVDIYITYTEVNL